MNADGHPDLILAGRSSVILTILSGARDDLLGLDAVDGRRDGTIALAAIDEAAGLLRVARGSGRWSSSLPAFADVDGDARPDLLLRLVQGTASAGIASTDIRVLSGRGLARDVDVGGTITVDELAADSGSYIFHRAQGTSDHMAGVDAVGDLDGDDREDFVLFVTEYRGDSSWGSTAYLVFAADLHPLDDADGVLDGRIFLNSIESERF